MSVRNLSVAGLGAFALGGLLLVLGLPAAGLGALATAGVAVLLIGAGLVAVALLAVARTEHRLLRRQGEEIRELRTALAGLAGPATQEVPPALAERFAALEATVEERADLQRRELLRQVDARVLGIHGTVRDLVERAGSSPTGDRPPGGDASSAGDRPS